MPKVSIKDVLNKSYLRQKPITSEFHLFCNLLSSLKNDIDQGCAKKESEEFHKNLIASFLSEVYYKKSGNLINTKDRIDYAIYETTDCNSQIQVLIEAKRPGNKNEFPTQGNINSKAMQESLLYYLRERELSHNIELKHVVITNGYEWFVFDACDFEKYFVNNKELMKHYYEFEVEPNLFNDNTSFFYKEIASPAINKVKDKMPFVYFDIRLLCIGGNNDKEKVNVFKLLSPQHLLRKFVCNDSNELNASFYNELLYILGLEEVKDGNKKIIRRLNEISRNKASFIENAINQIEDQEPNKDKQFETALSLTITWINRILFLKLLESQLVNYHKGNKDYLFLNSNKITGFDDLNQLFFKVLAVPTKDRNAEIASKYKNVPYLNSSLFELTAEENLYKISGLRDDAIPVHKATILRNNRDSNRLSGELKILDYLFKFLDAYDFGSEYNDGFLTRDAGKILINASVLGLIFEKINGYKDGSFFTPGFVTEYMCREALRSTVVRKFNEEMGWQCKTFEDLCEKDIADSEKANAIINSLRICDPAVGSGHFLVSALNELLFIKSELHILKKKDGKRLKNKVFVENDELFVCDDDDEPFVYNPKNSASQLIQESLFEEKRNLIENCLFGVDINPNSVNICRLRLWIELLKNAYYKTDGEFETLPNIDINIKTGNSLVSYYPIKVGTAVSKDVNFEREINEYKKKVVEYKRTSDKETKNAVKQSIKNIKNKLATYRLQLNLELEKSDSISNSEAGKGLVYGNSLEWMIEFPEVMDEKGKYLGFDCVIGNPPYGVKIDGDYRQIVEKKYGHCPGYEIYFYFVELSRKLLKPEGDFAFIIPNAWLFNNNACEYRKRIFDNWYVEELLDCTSIKLFQTAVVRNAIVHFRKSTQNTDGLYYRPTAGMDKWKDLVSKERMKIEKDDLLQMNQNWGLAFKLDFRVISLINKIADNDNTISCFFDCTQGYIPYRLSDLIKTYGEVEGKRIKCERLWHSKNQSEEYWIQELFGGDINKYNYHPTGSWVKYGSHVATYVDMRFFNQKRVVVREITNPGVIACIVEDSLINDPQLLPLVKKTDQKQLEYEFIWAILNSKLATFYHFNHSPKATKGDFPKILVDDLKNFPLPNVDISNQQVIISLAKNILETKKNDIDSDTSDMESEIDYRIYKLYGLTFDEAKLIDPNIVEDEFNKY